MEITNQYQLTDYLIKKADLTPYKYATFTLILLSSIGLKGWVSKGMLMKKTGCTIKQIDAHLRLLERLGVITLTQEDLRGTGNISTVFTFNIQRLLGEKS